MSDIPNDFMISFGPSTAFHTQSSSFNETNRPFLKADNDILVFLETGLGYYFDSIDSALNLSYRSIRFDYSAYNVSQVFSRRVLSLEFYKFLFDYHGFFPYLGVSLNRESLSVTEQNNFSYDDNLIRPSLVERWDIRSTRHPIWLLRTNVRVTPNLSLRHPDHCEFLFDQFKFNFIQVVLYPKRLFSKF